jgi:hypothetical protein
MPGWVFNLISALKLSGRIIAGLFLACLVALAVCTANLGPDVMVMKSTKNRV